MADRDRSAVFAREIGKLYVSLRDRSFEEFEQAMLDFEARSIADASDLESLEMKRRIAEEILMGAYVRNVEWPQFSRSLDRIHALGYSNVGRQVHVACLFARWAHSKREHQLKAREGLLEAERCASASMDEATKSEMMASISTTLAAIE